MNTARVRTHRSIAGGHRLGRAVAAQQIQTRILPSLILTLLLVVRAAAAQQAAPQPPDYRSNPEWFPRFYKPYVARQVPETHLENSAALTQMVHDGRVALTLSGLKALVMDNNLDVAAASYNTSMAETDLLRAKGGGAPRGAPGVRIPSGLFAGAIGAGLGDIGGFGGFGGAGGISGGARQVVARPRGSFDPTLALNFSMDRNVSPLNTIVVSGVPTVSTSTTALQARYSQAFTTGTTISITFNNQRQSSTQRRLRFNPALVSSFSLTVTQQLLNGFGWAVTRRFTEVARNGLDIARESYRQQAIAAVAQAENLYWDLAAARENVLVAEQSLTVAKQLLEDNRIREEIGKFSRMEVITAESEVAARQRDLIVAQANLQMKELDLKTILSRQVDRGLAAARIEAIDPLPEPKGEDIPKLDVALAMALRSRPEILQAEGNILNQEVAIKFAKNLLKPTLTLFGLVSSAGLWGERVISDPYSGANIVLPGGISQVLRQVRSFSHPEYAFGLSLSIPLLNRSAQADNVRARLEKGQAETALQQTRNRISVEVRNAVIALVQSKARIDAARKAVELSDETLHAEEEKLLTGLSTPYEVIRRQRDLRAAQFEYVRARTNYAKARVELNRSTGVMLEK